MDSIWLLDSRGCLLEQEARLQQLVDGERLEEENLWDSHEVGTGGREGCYRYFDEELG